MGGLKWKVDSEHPNIEDKRLLIFNPDRSETHRGINRVVEQEKSLIEFRVDLLSRLGEQVYRDINTRLQNATLHTARYINTKFKEHEDREQ